MDTGQAVIESPEILQGSRNGADLRRTSLGECDGSLGDVGNRDEPVDARRVRGEDPVKPPPTIATG